MTASRIEMPRLLQILEALALGRQLFQEWRQAEARTELRPILFEFRDHVFQAHRIAVEHRAPAIHWHAEAIDPNAVDTRRPDRDLLFENFRALVDHRVHAALEDFLVG